MQGSQSWTHSGHCENYDVKIRSVHPRLQSVWDELEMSAEDQTELLIRISTDAEAVWDKAMHAAETSLETAREEIIEAERRTAKLKTDLGDEHFNGKVGAARNFCFCKMSSLSWSFFRGSCREPHICHGHAVCPHAPMIQVRHDKPVVWPVY